MPRRALSRSQHGFPASRSCACDAPAREPGSFYGAALEGLPPDLHVRRVGGRLEGRRPGDAVDGSRAGVVRGQRERGRAIPVEHLLQIQRAREDVRARAEWVELELRSGARQELEHTDRAGLRAGGLVESRLDLRDGGEQAELHVRAARGRDERGPQVGRDRTDERRFRDPGSRRLEAARALRARDDGQGDGGRAEERHEQPVHPPPPPEAAERAFSARLGPPSTPRGSQAEVGRGSRFRFRHRGSLPALKPRQAATSLTRNGLGF